MSLNGLDPKVIKRSSSYTLLKILSEFFLTVLSSAEDYDVYLNEILQIQLDENLPSAVDKDGNPVRLDQ